MAVSVMLRSEHTSPFAPRLRICALVWASHQQKLSYTIEKVRKRAARWVCGVTWRPNGHGWSRSYFDLCNQLQWLMLERMRQFLIYCQMLQYTILHNLDCIKSTDYFTTKNRYLRSQPYSVITPHSCTNVLNFIHFLSMLPISGTPYHLTLFNHPLLVHLHPIYSNS